MSWFKEKWPYLLIGLLFVVIPVLAWLINKIRDIIWDLKGSQKTLQDALLEQDSRRFAATHYDPEVRRAVAERLSGDSNYMEDLSPLLALLRDKDIDVRRAATIQLQTTPRFMIGFNGNARIPGAHEAVPALRRALSQPKNKPIYREIEKALQEWTKPFK